jgi:nucleolar protein 12
MSLLGSIFGGGDDKVAKKSKKGKKAEVPENQVPDMFAKSAQLPERPAHEPAPPRKEKRKQEAEEPPKKRRKPRKTPEEQAEEAKKDPVEAETVTEQQEGGNDEDDAEARTVFVGNLPLQGTTRKSLAALFKDCGAVESARIRSVPVKGIKLPPQRAGDQNLMKKVCVNTKLVDYENSMKDTVMGYVVFKKEESVSKALELNNVLTVQGRRIRVDRASPSVEPSRSVFIGNLPYAADEMTLQDHFVKGCSFEVGDVEGVRIIRDKETYHCKGFGYVLLREKSMIPTALKLHDSVYMKKNIRVLVCGKRFKNKKGLVATSKVNRTPDVTGTATAPKETVTVGAFRRMLAKQSKEVAKITKRKRGEKKKTVPAKKGGPPGVSKRVVLEKKVEKRVKKIQKRISKGMGKTRR